MKKFLIIGICFFFIVGANSCDQNTADKKQTEQTDTLMAEAQRQVGMPNIVNFQQRKLMKMVYELADKDVIDFLLKMVKK